MGLTVFAAACGSTPIKPESRLPATKPAVTIHYTLIGSDSARARTGTDGRRHDTMTTSDPTTVQVGDTVTVIVANYDDIAHGMAFYDLGITKVIAPGRENRATTTTFTFAATSTGRFRWFCPVPCDNDSGQWAMNPDKAGPGQDGFMAGYITVA